MLQYAYEFILFILAFHWSVTAEEEPFDIQYYREMYSQLKMEFLDSLTDVNKQVCLKKIEEEISKESFSEIIKYSGKSFSSDQGFYSQCHANNFTYLLYVFDKLPNEEEYTMQFLKKRTFFYGLCIYDECYNMLKGDSGGDLIKRIIPKSSDVNIFPVRPEALGDQSTESSQQYYALVTAGLLLLFLGTKIFVWFFTMACKDEKREGSYSLSIQADSLNDSYEADSSLMPPDKPLPLLPTYFSKEEKEEFQIKEKKANAIKGVITFLNIHENIRKLIEMKNEYYDDTNLGLISFIRVLALFFMVYNHNFYCLLHLPVKNSTDSSFYFNFKLMLFKMSTFSVNTWIVIEGFILSFKFMSFAKKVLIKLNSSSLPFKYVLLFYIKSLSKVLSFIIVFLIISLGIKQFSILGLPPMFSYFLKYLNIRDCTTAPSSIFRPFSLLYKSYFNQTFGFGNCYKYFCVCLNTHFCFIFILLLLYASMRIRQKLFDLFIMLLIIINIGMMKISANFDYHSDKTKNYSINYFYGETYSMKFTHLFINFYFIGVIGGMMHFYYFDVISSNPFFNLNGSYRPLFFCFFLMKSIDSLNQVIKTLIAVLCLLVMAFVSLTYLLLFKRNQPNSFTFPITALYQFIDMYEKIFFVIAFLIMIQIISFTRNESSFKTFYSSSTFRLISRISFPIFCSMDNIIYLFYSIYYIVIIMNYNNILFISIGLMLLLIITNFIIIFTVEQPVKVITCLITSTRKKTEDFEEIQ